MKKRLYYGEYGALNIANHRTETCSEKMRTEKNRYSAYKAAIGNNDTIQILLIYKNKFAYYHEITKGADPKK